MSDLATRLTARPLYLQVRELLLQRVSAGEWKPGSSLPNEGLLAQHYGTSIGTVRKALDMLEEDRVVVRRQGRGTFVCEYSEKPLRFSSLFDAYGGRLLGEICVKQVGTVSADAGVAKRLGIRVGERVVRVARMRRNLSRVFMTEVCWLPEARYPSLPKSSDEFRIFSLAQMNAIVVGSGEERVRPGTARAEVAADLEVPEGTPVLMLDRIICCSLYRPLEWRVAHCTLQDEEFVIRYS